MLNEPFHFYLQIQIIIVCIIFDFKKVVGMLLQIVASGFYFCICCNIKLMQNIIFVNVTRFICKLLSSFAHCC
jgi:hypothetical protein